MPGKILKYASLFLAGILVIVLSGLFITQRVADGPIEFLQGGIIGRKLASIF